MNSKFLIRNSLKTSEEALRKAQRLKKGVNANTVCNIVKFGYDGFKIIIVGAKLYADMPTGKLPCPPDLRQKSALKYADIR